MSFDKSLRLLNYAKSELGGYLELYTELDHDFVVGDIVYIIGGYYDNTNELLYINNYSSGTPTKYNPFAAYKKGYEILFIDYTKNSFVINYPVNPLNLIYPYGTALNQFGDPQDNINEAYNTYNGANLYKDIYVSRTCFIKGRFNKGVINNGVFGNDYQIAELGKHQNMIAFSGTNDVIINHIGGKNIHITSGTINSKTDVSNPVTKKIELVEDLTINPVNPFALNNIVVGNNNDGFGYNTFERFIHYGDVIINNGVFDNPYNSRIIINGTAQINKFKFGSKEPMYINGCIIDDVSINNSTVYNKTPLNQLTLNTVNYDSFIDLNIDTLTWDVTPGNIILKVDYNVLANKIWTNGETVYIAGIIPPDNSYGVFNIDLYADIVSTTYIFGDLTSAEIVLYCPNLVADWATISLTDPNDYDLSNVKISFVSYDAQTLYAKENCNLSLHADNYDVYIDNNNNILLGKYFRATITNKVNVLGSSVGLNVFIRNSRQLVTDSAYVPSFNYSYLRNNNAITATINNSEIISGIIYNGSLANTLADPEPGKEIYLDNVVLYQGAKVEADVLWNDVNIQFYGETVSGTTYVLDSYLGDRKTPWKTEETGLAPLTIVNKSRELNKTTGTRGIDIAYYPAQHKIESAAPLGLAPVYDVVYEVPTLENVQLTVDTTKKFTIIDNGSMFYSGGGWYITPNFIKRPLFAGILNTNVPLRDAVLNRTNNTTIGTYSDFTGVALPPTNVSDIVRVDDKWVIRQNDHYYPVDAITRRDISINVYEAVKVPGTFPDPANNTPATLMFLKLEASTGPDIDNIYHDVVTPTAIQNTFYSFYFRQPGAFNNAALGAATTIPACFIEIEQVKIVKKDLADVIQSADIYYCNYCPSYTGATGGTEYTWDNFKTLLSYPTSFKILDNTATAIEFEMTALDKFDVYVEYWITWYYDESTLANTLENNPNIYTNYKGGYRTKHTLQHTFISSNETFYILGEGGDELVDDAGNNIVWI